MHSAVSIRRWKTNVTRKTSIICTCHEICTNEMGETHKMIEKIDAFIETFSSKELVGKTDFCDYCDSKICAAAILSVPGDDYTMNQVILFSILFSNKLMIIW